MNKKIIALTLVLTAPFTAQASSVDSMCQAVAGAARVTMEARQNGVGLATLRQALWQSPLAKVDKTHWMMMSVYEEPLYSSPAYKRKVLKEFENKIYLDCLRDPMSWTFD